MIYVRSLMVIQHSLIRSIVDRDEKATIQMSVDWRKDHRLNLSCFLFRFLTPAVLVEVIQHEMHVPTRKVHFK